MLGLEAEFGLNKIYCMYVYISIYTYLEIKIVLLFGLGLTLPIWANDNKLFGLDLTKYTCNSRDSHPLERVAEA